MKPLVVVPPAPLLTLDQVKAHVRPDTDEADEYLRNLVAVAQGQIDGPAGWLGLSVGPQTLEGRGPSLAALAGDGEPLPYGPVIEVVSADVIAPDGTTVAVDPAAFLLADDTLTLAPGRTWPTAAPRPDAARLRYRAGFPPAGDPPVSTVPAPILQALLVMVALLYENRLGDVDLAGNRTVAGLLAPFRRWGA